MNQREEYGVGCVRLVTNQEKDTMTTEVRATVVIIGKDIMLI